MLATRRIRSIDDMDNETEDFQRIGLVGRPKRRYARPPRTAADEHDIRVRAVKVLLDAGFYNDEIAIATDRTDRWVRGVAAEIRELIKERSSA